MELNTRGVNCRISILRFSSIALILFSGCGATSSPSTLTFPLNGTWKLTTATCNGTTATGTAAILTTPQYEEYVISGLSGSYVIYLSSTCTITAANVVSYPVANQVTITPVTGTTYSCSSTSACVAASFNNCGAAVSPSGTTFTYTNLTGTSTGNTVTFTATSSDNTCSTATPVQTNPVAYTLTHQ